MPASIITIVNQKGGTGKTTTTVNLSVALAKTGKRVLVLDLDSQGNLTYHFGINEADYTMADVFFGDASLRQAMVEREGVHIVPANISLADVELSLTSYNKREYILKEKLDAIADEYDYIMMDCAPSLSVLTINALTAANKVLIPLQLEVLSLQGLSLIMDTIFNIKESINPSISIMGVLPVMVDYRRKITHEVHDYLRNNFGIKVFDSIVKVDVKAIEAPSFGVSVLEYAPDAPSSKAYLEVAEEMVGLG
jgi:chromosome partitioning protein